MVDHFNIRATEPRLYGASARDADTPELVAPDGAPPGPWTVESSYRFCERMAAAHDENFPVASRFLPDHLRRSVTALYAFARSADDFADEPRYEGRRVEALDAWQGLLEGCYHREVQHPVFTALRDTVRTHEIPITPFMALLTASRIDLTTRRYATFSELRRYCALAANPIGQLVLHIHGYHEPHLHRLSDEICAALQITNFLQDLSVDVPRGRFYLPEEDLIHFGVTRDDLLAGISTRAFKELMAFSVARARALFLRGRPLIRQVSPGLSMELDATWRGGMSILQRIEALDDELLRRRPTLSRRDMAEITSRSLFSFGRRLVARAWR
ncbi:MAG: squalene synthase HpnC [Nannocystis sp.]|nr:squalene synthase HpnC [Nannocystis sp.]